MKNRVVKGNLDDRTITISQKQYMEDYIKQNVPGDMTIKQLPQQWIMTIKSAQRSLSKTWLANSDFWHIELLRFHGL